ncbi:angio-associated migratory cell protein [Chelonus insularis]|uniref:angio-associated migratory cell protein n=1 Tax=Chelonus insularis TaxID=460826 RepID=UPI00158C1EDA|nr:angio-associated migratory cell protein [Chelonus insularis]XP_034950315.1 angio-associated migratory cell protein [Chelonus insularis]
MPEKYSPSPSHNLEEDLDLDQEEMNYIGDMVEVIDDQDDDEQDEMMEEDEEAAENDDIVTEFNRHEGSVFCGSLTNDGKLAATGGEDDMAYVWDTSSGEIIHECKGHKDSLIFTEFNHDNTYLATGDMSGIINVWRMSDKARIWDYNMGDATWMKWHSQANVLFAGSVDGEIYMWKIPSEECKVFQGYGQRTETATLTPDGKRLIAGYEDGAIRVLDLKEGTVQVTIPAGLAHTAAITDLDCQIDGKLIISAAVDGKTVLSTTQNGKIVSILQDLQGNKTVNMEAGPADDESESKDDWVEAVAFCKDPELPLVATGTLNGEIFIWDSCKQAIRHKITQENGVSKLVWLGTTPFLFSAGLDGVMRYYDGRTGRCIKSLWFHTEGILDLCISRDGKKILTTSDDSSARISDVPEC